LVALDAYEVPHYAEYVDLDPKKRQLPSGGTLVPEILDSSGSIVSDSEKIFHFLDEKYGTQLYAPKEASDLSVRASDKFLGGSVLYYNWVFYDSYVRSMRATIGRLALPKFVCFFRGSILDYFLRAPRAKEGAKAKAMMGEDVDFDDEPAVRKRLFDELAFFQSYLKMESQTYLLGTESPSAVDCSVYVMLERMVGEMGDVHVLPSLPDLKKETSPLLDRLWKWHAGMQKNHPIKFKGKRRPQHE
jgi:glutathione S-transferase